MQQFYFYFSSCAWSIKGREKIDKPGQTKQNEILTSQVEKEVASLEMQGMWEVQGN